MAEAARVGIVGGGLAGLAAASALVTRNLEVELFEAHSQLGGRSCQISSGDSESQIESCQQLGSGADVNLARFLARIGAARKWETQSRLHFYTEDGKRSDLYAFPGLPAPFHLAPSFFRLRILSLRQRWSVAQALYALGKPLSQDDADLSILRWLRLHDQPAVTINSFWMPLLAPNLGSALENISLARARQLVLSRYLLHRGGYHLRIPSSGMRPSLAEPAEKWLRTNGAQLHISSPVRLLLGSADRCQGVLFVNGSTRAFDVVIAAVPWGALSNLLSTPMRSSIPKVTELEQQQGAAVTYADLWFDRPLTPLAYVTLAGGVVGCVFRRHPRAAADQQHSGGFHYQVVLNESRRAADWTDEQTAREIRQILINVWPASRDAELIRSRILVHPGARFPSSNEFDPLRLGQITSVPNLMLAGDWTKTEKPASLESAVKSGYLAAEAVLQYLGQPDKVLAPELKPEWLARRVFNLD